MDGTAFLAYFLIFERASQRLATGGSKSGRGCTGVTFAFGQEELRRTVSSRDRLTASFQGLASYTTFAC